MASVPSVSAALVIRIWREPGVRGFRGRISSTDAGDSGVAVRDSEQVHAVVQEWLDQFTDGPAEHGRNDSR
jgi:hypothetical protein